MDLQGFGDGCKTFIPDYLLADINEMRLRQEFNANELDQATLAYYGTQPFDAIALLSVSLGDFASSFRYRINDLHKGDAPKVREELIKLLSHCLAYVCMIDHQYLKKDDAQLQKILDIANKDVAPHFPKN